MLESKGSVLHCKLSKLKILPQHRLGEYRKVITKGGGKEFFSIFLIIHSRSYLLWIGTAPLDTSCTFIWILIYFSLSEFR